jgi:hypothetical protein
MMSDEHCIGCPRREAQDAEIERLRGIERILRQELRYRVQTDDDIKMQNMEIERLQTELKIRAEWFEKMNRPGLADATRAAIAKAEKP